MRNSFFFTCILFSFFLLPCTHLTTLAQEAHIYRWIDEKGIQHFSDVPPQPRKPIAQPPQYSSRFQPPEATSQTLVTVEAMSSRAPTQAEVPLSTILAPEEQKNFVRRGIRLDQKILILFDDTY